MRIDADENADVLRGYAAARRGAPRVWERSRWSTATGRIGALDTVFFDTLLDENAASHIALGRRVRDGRRTSQDVDRINASSIHVDFMIGGPEVETFGVTADGAEVPVMIGGQWQV